MHTCHGIATAVGGRTSRMNRMIATICVPNMDSTVFTSSGYKILVSSTESRMQPEGVLFVPDEALNYGTRFHIPKVKPHFVYCDESTLPRSGHCD